MLRDLIPAKARLWVYAILGAATPLLALLPGRWAGIAAAVLAASGFSLAAGNTPR